MIGTYKPETEYGLIDGFKWNFGKRENGQKFVEIKSETESEIKRVEREKFSPKNQVQSEYELFRFMEQNIVPF